ncbi:uncharacterized protein LOC122510185 [Leptopilina heterotoma]|uniref:uncharacterized protein LOC122510185 n=1 Tax=Leptopilina heterotoma TaxID=63436 RepID=UPI001CAA3113|nr:uncharacterized protein LOC122510185 [Leptopilina heterotoma]
MMDKHYFSPRDHQEEVIQQNYDHISRRNTWLFLIGSVFTLAALSLGGLTRSEVVLPFRATLPFDSNNNKIIFCLTYVSQSLSLYSSGLTNIGVETLIMSLKVADIISMIDWTMLRRQSKQGLILIAMRARNPIIITGGSLISMSLNTFVTILRASYTSYNLLKSSRV